MWSISGGRKLVLHDTIFGAKNRIAQKYTGKVEKKTDSGKRIRSLGCHGTSIRQPPKVGILKEVPSIIISRKRGRIHRTNDVGINIGEMGRSVPSAIFRVKYSTHYICCNKSKG